MKKDEKEEETLKLGCFVLVDYNYTIIYKTNKIP